MKPKIEISEIRRAAFEQGYALGRAHNVKLERRRLGTYTPRASKRWEKLESVEWASVIAAPRDL